VEARGQETAGTKKENFYHHCHRFSFQGIQQGDQARTQRANWELPPDGEDNKSLQRSERKPWTSPVMENSFIFIIIVLMPQLILDPQPPPDRKQKSRYDVTHASPLILAHITLLPLNIYWTEIRRAGLIPKRHFLSYQYIRHVVAYVRLALIEQNTV
jgi:hypothetical protein